MHFSEAAFYECALSDVQAGMGEAIVSGGIQIYETTANGFNEFEELWRSGSCVNVFYEWWRTAEYRSCEYKYLDKCDAWLEARKKLLFDLGLDREQVTWYCKKYNGYIDKALIRQEYPITPEEAFISTGESVFDKDLIYARLAELGDGYGRLGYFEYEKRLEIITDERGNPIGEQWHIDNIRFKASADGYIRLHEEPRVERDGDGDVIGLYPYAIGGDTAESGADFFTAKVVDVMSGKCAATLRRRKMDEELYAEQIYCLARFYNEAKVAIEINYSRHPVRVLRQKYGYTNLYLRRDVSGISDETLRDYGFETTKATKPIIIAELVALFRENPQIECDPETLREMLSFVKKDNGKQEADVGMHDDLVMASAIAHFAATVCEARVKKCGEDKPTFISRNFKNESGGGNYVNW